MSANKVEVPINLAICPPISPNELLGTHFSDQYNLPFGRRKLHFYEVFGGELIIEEVVRWFSIV